jgi:hypothetical protein
MALNIWGRLNNKTMYLKRRETERELIRMPNLTSCQQERWEQPVPPLPRLRHLLNPTGHYQLNPHLQDPRHQIHYPIPHKLLDNFQPTSKLQVRSGSRELRPQKLQRTRGRLPATLSLARSPRKCTMLGEYVANATLLNFSHCFVQKKRSSYLVTVMCAGGYFCPHCFCSRSHSTSLLRRKADGTATIRHMICSSRYLSCRSTCVIVAI